MDRYSAQLEIECLFSRKEGKSMGEIRAKLSNILKELQSYNFNLGKRQGIVEVVNLLTEFAEKEDKL